MCFYNDVKNQCGTVPYVLSKQTILDQKFLHLRTFTENQKHKKYKEQGDICPICHQRFEYNKMDGDHIIPWSKGGHTTYSNLQMLCKHDNRVKSNKEING